MKSLVDSGIHQLRQMKAVKMIIIWDVIPCSLVVFCASIFRVSMLKIEAALSSETLIPICDTSSVTSQRTMVFTVTAVSTSSYNKFLFLEYKNWERSVCCPVPKKGGVALLTHCLCGIISSHKLIFLWNRYFIYFNIKWYLILSTLEILIFY